MIILLFGPPASGKTTIAKRLAEKLEDTYLLSSDQFRRSVYRQMMEEVKKRRGRQRYIIIDGTFYRKQWRDELREAAEGEEILEVFLNCSLQTSLRRNRERSKPIPEAAVHIIWRSFERPENPDVEIDADMVSVEEAVRRILEAIKRTS
jgi:adenylylsulfate kinase